MPRAKLALSLGDLALRAGVSYRSALKYRERAPWARKLRACKAPQNGNYGHSLYHLDAVAVLRAARDAGLARRGKYARGE